MMKPQKGPYVMFVDSDKTVRDSLKVFFENSPTQFLVFKTARQGLNSLKYQQVHLVVSDYFLPDMDGVAFLKEVSKIQPDALRVLMTTIASGELEEEIQQAGIDWFIEKPLTVATLDTVINELKQSKMSNQSRR